MRAPVVWKSVGEIKYHKNVSLEVFCMQFTGIGDSAGLMALMFLRRFRANWTAPTASCWFITSRDYSLKRCTVNAWCFMYGDLLLLYHAAHSPFLWEWPTVLCAHLCQLRCMFFFLVQSPLQHESTSFLWLTYFFLSSSSTASPNIGSRIYFFKRTKW